ncbi:hypothetical protein BDBG_17207 [Blastomyces gilchristii SLH14081]|uniref:Uncharacterized protein n=1 Tax=Blastomyces gilchristii (strain SLH14081) TaxID=559298 RepID=A0A179UNK4_BLAGS|nr:uncharacterized protein BDBG_17207 [Blastomyces gilchristii SLH14081]OAT09413.1 hypothetical protein BDBG_17207 [Blastomyces gilchristii SLH14081]
MSSLFKYSAVLRTIKAHEHYHRLKREKKKIDLAERKQQKPFSEKAAERDFEMIIISDKKKKKKNKNKK